MGILNREQAQGVNNSVVAHVFGAPVKSSDSSQAVTTSASSVTLTEGKVYLVTGNVAFYMYFGVTGGDAATADNAAYVPADTPQVFRVPFDLPELHLLGSESGTVWVNEMNV